LPGTRLGDRRRRSDWLWRIVFDADTKNYANSSDRFQHGHSNREIKGPTQLT